MDWTMSEQTAKPCVVVLARWDQLADGDSRGFSIAREGDDLEGFLVRRGDEVYAYVNSCPHTGAPLDWMPDQFLDQDGAFIQCAMHGALFEIESGLCVRGPCVSRILKRLPVKADGEDVVLCL